MVFKFHNNRFDNLGRYYEIVREAMIQLGHREVIEDSEADIHFYNHISIWPRAKNSMIIKPTAPTARHFAIDQWGYANDSKMAYVEPDWMNPFDYSMNLKTDREHVQHLIKQKSNKWDDSILLKWRKTKIKIPEEHILIIGQQPHDETVNGFGFGDHWKKLCQIVDAIDDEPMVIKLHPGMKGKDKEIEKWRAQGKTVIDGYVSIHDVLPHARVAVLENSTAGIECMMHKVPIIFYGFPEYHWITEKIQTLPHLKTAVRDISWYSEKENEMFLHWYINRYLCKDVESTKQRIQNILWM